MLSMPLNKIVRYVLSLALCLTFLCIGTVVKGESTGENIVEILAEAISNPEESNPEDSKSEDDNPEENGAPTLFPDVEEEHWAFTEINELVENEIVVRPLEENFEPDQKVTRADLIRMILRGKGVYSPKIPLSYSRFKDVSTDLDTYPYIEVAYSMAITNGGKQGTFNPLGAISREKTVAMIIRAMGKEAEAKQFNLIEETLAPYVDQGEISPEYREFLAYAVALEMVTGVEKDGKLYLDPQHFTTRAEAAAMVARFILPERKGLQVEMVDGMNIFYQKKMELEATAYSSEQPNLSNYTSTGLLVRQGIVAVNPEVIPYGTHLYIQGYGYAVAGDTGGSMLNNGNKIDVAFSTLAEARKFGRQKVQVFFLNGNH